MRFTLRWYKFICCQICKATVSENDRRLFCIAAQRGFKPEFKLTVKEVTIRFYSGKEVFEILYYNVIKFETYINGRRGYWCVAKNEFQLTIQMDTIILKKLLGKHGNDCNEVIKVSLIAFELTFPLLHFDCVVELRQFFTPRESSQWRIIRTKPKPGKPHEC